MPDLVPPLAIHRHFYLVFHWFCWLAVEAHNWRALFAMAFIYM
jgi:hypothetical protein